MGLSANQPRDAALPRSLALACLDYLDTPAEQLVAAAAAAGFTHVTLRVTGSRDPVPADVGADPRRLRRVRRELAASGVAVLDVEVVRMGPDLTDDEISRAAGLAAELGAGYLLTVNAGFDRIEATARLAGIVERAAGSGIRPCLEPMRFSACRTLGDAVATAVPAGAGVLVDALHLQRSGGGPDDLRAALAQHGAELFPYLQVCDAPAVIADDDEEALRREAIGDRLLPGDGELPLAALLAELPGVPLCVEAPYRGLRDCSPQERAAAAMTALRRLVPAGASAATGQTADS